MTWHWAVSLEDTHGREGCSRAQSLAPLPAYPTNAASGSLSIHTLLSFPLANERAPHDGVAGRSNECPLFPSLTVVRNGVRKVAQP